ncbi:type II toxin-antitoxin system PemK/MazF family toxin [Clostridium algidicarnis]|uniref:Type II toxin-antitoxin system PemK/MazF family toxin n=1 Tax=Clostridium algidicarnis TaxID=37659 RepID=A0ABS6C6C8_9CLOT|nr:type II toxin-antitoxin system PemK/MazF family toxin [Clostridium algidicarnis]MBB6632489.1 type II toxin-antitoxin system PemK/MazF family toxin [Clostridium algidicarnis]MBU3207986.1 type II toxin-antitoxin system PemK/MazF family toxin [Clostridium algidicarnis]MBU3221033.1 type II toxin-antitoxin system PemK/MazF family toxin [Clostridium algidicarnis]MCB2288127.1 type II toxin-antitoxin system PemK/MazF family toxin [Clostridium algidicarnis]
MSNCAPKRGEVWFVEFPLEEDNSKTINRPVIVLSESDEELEVLSVKITKHAPRDEWDYPLLYWNEASLRLASTARVSKASYLAQDDFIFKIGDLHKDDLEKVDKLFVKYIESNQ